MLAVSDMITMRKFGRTSDWETSGMADIFETAELFKTFVTMRLMLAGPVGGTMAWVWTRGWHDAGDFGHDVDAKFVEFKLSSAARHVTIWNCQISRTSLDRLPR